MSYSDSFRTLWNEAKNYLELQKEYLKLDTAEKLSVFYLLPIVAIGIAFTISGAMMLFSKKHPDNDKLNVTLWIIYFVVLFVEDITFLFDVLL